MSICNLSCSVRFAGRLPCDCIVQHPGGKFLNKNATFCEQTVNVAGKEEIPIKNTRNRRFRVTGI